jgi:hypothetical protein
VTNVYHFTGHVALVTGGTRGIGAATASRRVVDGARVAVFDLFSVVPPVPKGGGRGAPKALRYSKAL